MIYSGASRELVDRTKIDDRVAHCVAKLLTSSKIDDFERGDRIVSRSITLFRAFRNEQKRDRTFHKVLPHRRLKWAAGA
jgi:hypothetical protein